MVEASPIFAECKELYFFFRAVSVFITEAYSQAGLAISSPRSFLSTEITETSQLLHGLLIEGGLSAAAERALDLLLRVHPSADLRHHAIDLQGMLRGHVLFVSPIGPPIVKFGFV